MTTTQSTLDVSDTATSKDDQLLALCKVAHALQTNDANKGDKIEHGGDQGGSPFMKFREAVRIIQQHLTEADYEQFWMEINDGRAQKIALAPYGHEQQKLPNGFEITAREFLLTFARILGL